MQFLPLLGHKRRVVIINFMGFIHKHYAGASVEKKKEAIEKAMFGLNSIIQKEEFWYKKDETTIKHLYGL